MRRDTTIEVLEAIVKSKESACLELQKEVQELRSYGVNLTNDVRVNLSEMLRLEAKSLREIIREYEG